MNDLRDRESLTLAELMKWGRENLEETEVLVTPEVQSSLIKEIGQAQRFRLDETVAPGTTFHGLVIRGC